MMGHAKRSASPGWWAAYRLRWKRRRLLWRSFRSRRYLRAIQNRTAAITRHDILCVTVVHNEIARLPKFLDHYRRLGVAHFLIVDNNSDDGSTGFLRAQPDVSLWHTCESYRAARFGLDWLTWLQMRYCHDHWTVMADADELLIYAYHDRHPLPDLTRWLNGQGQHAFGALMLDLYPQAPLGTQDARAEWFDLGPYRAQRQQPLGNLWVQGGVRERVFLADAPHRSPTLNKLPLVRWSRRYACVNSCHSILPRRLNFAYDGPGGSAPSGVLLHTKFGPGIVAKSAAEKQRAQHFAHPEYFVGYYAQIAGAPTLWSKDSRCYENWQQLEHLGLLSAGGWRPRA